MQKIKIALVIPSLQAGGMERVMSELISNYTEKKEVELHLILYGIKRDIFYTIPDTIKIHRPDFPFNNNRRLFSTIQTIFFLRNKIKSLEPDTILSFGEVWNNFVLLSLYGTSFPIYVSDRCQPDKKLGGYHNWLRNWLYPYAAGIIVQTEKAKNIYAKNYSHPNIKVIGNPIRPFTVSEIYERENIVLSVGRLIASKHHDELIRNFAALDRPNWKLVIIGGDAIRQQNMVKLQKLIQELGMTEKIILTGSIKNVAEYYLKSKIFAFTSSSEGFPNVIGEALASGIPVVSFDCVAGPSEMVVDGHNGHLIKLFDYDTFSQRLAKLMDDDNHRQQLAQNTVESIQQFDKQVISEVFYNTITAHIENSTN